MKETSWTARKLLFFILELVFTAVLFLSVLATIYIESLGIYRLSYDELVYNTTIDIASYEAETIADYVGNEKAEFINSCLQSTNIYSCEVTELAPEETVYIWENKKQPETDGIPFTTKINSTVIEMKIDRDFSLYEDTFYTAAKTLSLFYHYRYLVIAGIVIGAIGALLNFILLVMAAGHYKGKDGVAPGWGTRFPFEITTFAAFIAICSFFALGVESFYYSNDVVSITLFTFVICLCVFLGTAWAMSLAIRIKLHILYEGSLLKIILRKLKSLWGFLKSIFVMIPVFLRASIIIFCVIACEALLLLTTRSAGFAAFLFLAEKLTFVILFFYALKNLVMLHKGSTALAEGDLSYQIPTESLRGPFLSHAQNLNRIGEGMAIAVEERLKSERMKTELITNVSHDIKTPLTSIINYSDLIGRETCDNPTITEYAEVLNRQSKKLKRLIEDLVEASKASTGNNDIQLMPCSADIILTQAAGEYEEKFTEKDLNIILSQPQETLMIMADSRRMWRVFDNLLGNIYKYAMPGTRVYLSLQKTDDSARFVFRNISKDELSISSGELLERFVRGDSSRNTEGNGLGLSIAQSLTELQGGSLKIETDGDLFKVILEFPLIKE